MALDLFSRIFGASTFSSTDQQDQWTSRLVDKASSFGCSCLMCSEFLWNYFSPASAALGAALRFF